MPVITIAPLVDVYVYNGETANNNTNVKLEVGYHSTGGLAHTLFKVDLSSIPANSTINSATITVNTTAENASPDVIIRPELITAAFDQTTVVFTNQPTHGGTVDTNFTVTGLGLKTLTITKVIQALVNGSGYGFGLYTQNTANTGYVVSFDSMESTGTKPSISIDYTPPITNKAPDAPAITSPIAGSTYTASPINLTGSATDPEADTVQLEWSYSRDGVNWNIITTTAGVASGTSQATPWDVTGFVTASTYQVRARAVDSKGAYGGYTTTNTFTISGIPGKNITVLVDSRQNLSKVLEQNTFDNIWSRPLREGILWSKRYAAPYTFSGWNTGYIEKPSNSVVTTLSASKQVLYRAVGNSTYTPDNRPTTTKMVLYRAIGDSTLIADNNKQDVKAIIVAEHNTPESQNQFEGQWTLLLADRGSIIHNAKNVTPHTFDELNWKTYIEKTPNTVVTTTTDTKQILYRAQGNSSYGPDNYFVDSKHVLYRAQGNSTYQADNRRQDTQTRLVSESGTPESQNRFEAWATLLAARGGFIHNDKVAAPHTFNKLMWDTAIEKTPNTVVTTVVSSKQVLYREIGYSTFAGDNGRPDTKQILYREIGNSTFSGDNNKQDVQTKLKSASHVDIADNQFERSKINVLSKAKQFGTFEFGLVPAESANTGYILTIPHGNYAAITDVRARLITEGNVDGSPVYIANGFDSGVSSTLFGTPKQNMGTFEYGHPGSTLVRLGNPQAVVGTDVYEKISKTWNYFVDAKQNLIQEGNKPVTSWQGFEYPATPLPSLVPDHMIAPLFEDEMSANALTNWLSRGSVAGSSVQYLTEAGKNYARVTGFRWYAANKMYSFDPNKMYRLRVRVRRPVNAEVGKNAKFYMGLEGYLADGVTLCNYMGQNTSGSQHYFNASYSDPSTDWMEYVAWIKGNAPAGSNGDTSKTTTPSDPGRLHPNVRFFRPLFIANYPDSVQAVTDIEYEVVEIVGTPVQSKFNNFEYPSTQAGLLFAGQGNVVTTLTDAKQVLYRQIGTSTYALDNPVWSTKQALYRAIGTSTYAGDNKKQDTQVRLIAVARKIDKKNRFGDLHSRLIRDSEINVDGKYYAPETFELDRQEYGLGYMEMPLSRQTTYLYDTKQVLYRNIGNSSYSLDNPKWDAKQVLFRAIGNSTYAGDNAKQDIRVKGVAEAGTPSDENRFDSKRAMQFVLGERLYTIGKLTAPFTFNSLDQEIIEKKNNTVVTTIVATKQVLYRAIGNSTYQPDNKRQDTKAVLYRAVGNSSHYGDNPLWDVRVKSIAAQHVNVIENQFELTNPPVSILQKGKMLGTFDWGIVEYGNAGLIYNMPHGNYSVLADTKARLVSETANGTLANRFDVGIPSYLYNGAKVNIGTFAYGKFDTLIPLMNPVVVSGTDVYQKISQTWIFKIDTTAKLIGVRRNPSVNTFDSSKMIAGVLYMSGKQYAAPHTFEKADPFQMIDKTTNTIVTTLVSAKQVLFRAVGNSSLSTDNHVWDTKQVLYRAIGNSTFAGDNAKQDVQARLRDTYVKRTAFDYEGYNTNTPLKNTKAYTNGFERGTSAYLIAPVGGKVVSTYASTQQSISSPIQGGVDIRANISSKMTYLVDAKQNILQTVSTKTDMRVWLGINQSYFADAKQSLSANVAYVTDTKQTLSGKVSYLTDAKQTLSMRYTATVSTKQALSYKAAAGIDSKQAISTKFLTVIDAKQAINSHAVTTVATQQKIVSEYNVPDDVNRFGFGVQAMVVDHNRSNNTFERRTVGNILVAPSGAKKVVTVTDTRLGLTSPGVSLVDSKQALWNTKTYLVDSNQNLLTTVSTKSDVNIVATAKAQANGDAKQVIFNTVATLVDVKQVMYTPNVGSMIDMKQVLYKPTDVRGDTKQILKATALVNTDAKQVVYVPTQTVTDAKAVVTKPTTVTLDTRQVLYKPLSTTSDAKQVLSSRQEAVVDMRDNITASATTYTATWQKIYLQNSTTLADVKVTLVELVAPSIITPTANGSTINRRPVINVKSNDYAGKTIQARVRLYSDSVRSTLIHTAMSSSFASGTSTTVVPTVDLPVQTLYAVVDVVLAGGTSYGPSTDFQFTIKNAPWSDTIVDTAPGIRAVWLNDLANAINELRAFRGLALTTFTDGTLVGGVNDVRSLYFAERRTALTEALVTINVTPMWQAASLDATTDKKGILVNELRDALKQG